MRKICLMLIMLGICLSSAAQNPQTKGTTRRQTTTATKQKKTNKDNTPNKKELQTQQQRLRKNIAINKQQKAELEKKVKQQLEEVLTLATEIDEQKHIIDTIRAGIDSIDRQIDTLNTQTQKLQEELSERQKRYANSVRYMHRNRNMRSKLMFILSAKNINQMYRRTRFINEYATYQKAQGEAVKQKKKQLDQKRMEMAQAKGQRRDLLETQEKERQTLQQQQDQKQQMANELQKQQRTVTALIEQQQKEEAAINAQIERIVAEEIAREQARIEAERKRKEEQARMERERQQREQKAREQREREQKEREKALARQQKQEKKQDKAIEKQVRRESRKMAQKAQKSQKSQKPQQSQQSQKPQQSQFTSADPDAKLSGSFASNKGRLPMPITGAYQMIRGFGDNVVDDTKGVHLTSKGIYLKGQPGAQARCVFDGEVSRIFSTGASYIVMVRHGRFISVYSDLATVSVTAGQKVSTSQTLGRLGPTNTMQFQLRNWTELLNPRLWLRR